MPLPLKRRLNGAPVGQSSASLAPAMGAPATAAKPSLLNQANARRTGMPNTPALLGGPAAAGTLAAGKPAPPLGTGTVKPPSLLGGSTGLTVRPPVAPPAAALPPRVLPGSSPGGATIYPGLAAAYENQANLPGGGGIYNRPPLPPVNAAGAGGQPMTRPPVNTTGGGQTMTRPPVNSGGMTTRAAGGVDVAPAPRPYTPAPPPLKLGDPNRTVGAHGAGADGGMLTQSRSPSGGVSQTDRGGAGGLQAPSLLRAPQTGGGLRAPAGGGGGGINTGDAITALNEPLQVPVPGQTGTGGWNFGFGGSGNNTATNTFGGAVPVAPPAGTTPSPTVAHHAYPQSYGGMSSGTGGGLDSRALAGAGATSPYGDDDTATNWSDDGGVIDPDGGLSGGDPPGWPGGDDAGEGDGAVGENEPGPDDPNNPPPPGSGGYEGGQGGVPGIDGGPVSIDDNPFGDPYGEGGSGYGGGGITETNPPGIGEDGGVIGQGEGGLAGGTGGGPAIDDGDPIFPPDDLPPDEDQEGEGGGEGGQGGGTGGYPPVPTEPQQGQQQQQSSNSQSQSQSHSESQNTGSSRGESTSQGTSSSLGESENQSTSESKHLHTMGLDEARNFFGPLAREGDVANPYSARMEAEAKNQANARISAGLADQLEQLGGRAGAGGIDPNSLAAIYGRQGLMGQGLGQQLQSDATLGAQYAQNRGQFDLSQKGMNVGQRGQDYQGMGYNAGIANSLLGQADSRSQSTGRSNQRSDSQNTSDSWNESENQGTSVADALSWMYSNSRGGSQPIFFNNW